MDRVARRSHVSKILGNPDGKATKTLSPKSGEGQTDVRAS